MGIFCDTKNNIYNSKEKEKKSNYIKILNQNLKSDNESNSFIEQNNYFPGNKKIIDKYQKSLCRINIKVKGENRMATGFFMNIDNSKKYLITAYHSINEKVINDDIRLEIYNKNIMVLKPENRDIKFFKKKDITIIEIKETDEIFKYIKFLYYDSNYIYGYKIYLEKKVLCIQVSFGEIPYISIGKIINIDNFKFEHNISIEKGATGSPIALLNENSEEILVIGIHKEASIYKQVGTFIGEIFYDLEKRIYLKYNEICVVIFISTDQLINYPISCKITDNFSYLENKLFEQFQNLRNKNIYFLANGNVINRASTLLENNIKNDTTILICVEE